MGRLNTYLLQAAAMAAGAGALYVSRPDRDSFRPFLTRWLKDKLKARQASSASSSTSSFLDGVSQWFDTQVSAVTAEGTQTFVLVLLTTPKETLPPAMPLASFGTKS
eukprot:m.47933 g.47933  ORF g.47933 m.47933 type:complete len:107 (-) comp11956_c0_seq2:27-347(-)